KKQHLYAQFVRDFLRLYNQFLSETSSDFVQIEDVDYQSMSLCFEHFDESNLEDEKILPTLKLFYLFWKCLHDQIEKEYYEMFLRSNYYLKYELEILKSNSVELSDILFANTYITFSFLDFMNSEEMKNYVDFL